MDEFFPSEVARLILGYLNEVNCLRTWQTFLEESSNLQEYYLLYRKGKVYSTNVNGKSLLEILSEYCALKKNLKNGASNFDVGEGHRMEHYVFENSFNAKIKDITEEVVKKVINLSFEKPLSSFHGNKSCLSSTPHSTESIASSESVIPSSSFNENNNVFPDNTFRSSEEEIHTNNCDEPRDVCGEACANYTELNSTPVIDVASDTSSMHLDICEVFSLSNAPNSFFESPENEKTDKILTTNSALNESASHFKVVDADSDKDIQNPVLISEHARNITQDITNECSTFDDQVRNCHGDAVPSVSNATSNDLLMTAISLSNIQEIGCQDNNNNKAFPSGSVDCKISTADCSFQNPTPTENAQFGSGNGVAEVPCNNQNALGQCNNFDTTLSTNKDCTPLFIPSFNQPLHNNLQPPKYVLSSFSGDFSLQKPTSCNFIISTPPYVNYPLILPKVLESSASKSLFITPNSGNTDENLPLSVASSTPILYFPFTSSTSANVISSTSTTLTTQAPVNVTNLPMTSTSQSSANVISSTSSTLTSQAPVNVTNLPMTLTSQSSANVISSTSTTLTSPAPKNASKLLRALTPRASENVSNTSIALTSLVSTSSALRTSAGISSCNNTGENSNTKQEDALVLKLRKKKVLNERKKKVPKQRKKKEKSSSVSGKRSKFPSLKHRLLSYMPSSPQNNEKMLLNKRLNVNIPHSSIFDPPKISCQPSSEKYLCAKKSSTTPAVTVPGYFGKSFAQYFLSLGTENGEKHNCLVGESCSNGSKESQSENVQQNFAHGHRLNFSAESTKVKQTVKTQNNAKENSSFLHQSKLSEVQPETLNCPKNLSETVVSKATSNVQTGKKQNKIVATKSKTMTNQKQNKVKSDHKKSSKISDLSSFNKTQATQIPNEITNVVNKKKVENNPKMHSKGLGASSIYETQQTQITFENELNIVNKKKVQSNKKRSSKIHDTSSASETQEIHISYENESISVVNNNKVKSNPKKCSKISGTCIANETQETQNTFENELNNIVSEISSYVLEKEKKMKKNTDSENKSTIIQKQSIAVEKKVSGNSKLSNKSELPEMQNNAESSLKNARTKTPSHIIQKEKKLKENLTSKNISSQKRNDKVKNQSKGNSKITHTSSAFSETFANTSKSVDGEAFCFAQKGSKLSKSEGMSKEGQKEKVQSIDKNPKKIANKCAFTETKQTLNISENALIGSNVQMKRKSTEGATAEETDCEDRFCISPSEQVKMKWSKFSSSDNNSLVQKKRKLEECVSADDLSAQKISVSQPYVVKLKACPKLSYNFDETLIYTNKNNFCNHEENLNNCRKHGVLYLGPAGNESFASPKANIDNPKGVPSQISGIKFNSAELLIVKKNDCEKYDSKGNQENIDILEEVENSRKSSKVIQKPHKKKSAKDCMKKAKCKDPYDLKKRNVAAKSLKGSHQKSSKVSRNKKIINQKHTLLDSELADYKLSRKPVVMLTKLPSSIFEAKKALLVNSSENFACSIVPNSDFEQSVETTLKENFEIVLKNNASHSNIPKIKLERAEMLLEERAIISPESCYENRNLAHSSISEDDSQISVETVPEEKIEIFLGNNTIDERAASCSIIPNIKLERAEMLLEEKTMISPKNWYENRNPDISENEYQKTAEIALEEKIGFIKNNIVNERAASHSIIPNIKLELLEEETTMSPQNWHESRNPAYPDISDNDSQKAVETPLEGKIETFPKNNLVNERASSDSTIHNIKLERAELLLEEKTMISLKNWYESRNPAHPNISSNDSQETVETHLEEKIKTFPKNNLLNEKASSHSIICNIKLEKEKMLLEEETIMSPQNWHDNRNPAYSDISEDESEETETLFKENKIKTLEISNAVVKSVDPGIIPDCEFERMSAHCSGEIQLPLQSCDIDININERTGINIILENDFDQNTKTFVEKTNISQTCKMNEKAADKTIGSENESDCVATMFSGKKSEIPVNSLNQFSCVNEEIDNHDDVPKTEFKQSFKLPIEEEKEKIPFQKFNPEKRSSDFGIIIINSKSEQVTESSLKEKATLSLQNLNEIFDESAHHNIIADIEVGQVIEISSTKTSLQSFDAGINGKTDDHSIVLGNEFKSMTNSNELTAEGTNDISLQNLNSDCDTIGKINHRNIILDMECKQTSETFSKNGISNMNSEEKANHSIILDNELNQTDEAVSEQNVKKTVQNCDAVFYASEEIVSQSTDSDCELGQSAETFSDVNGEISVQNINAESDVTAKAIDTIIPYSKSKEIAENFSEGKAETSVENFNSDFKINEEATINYVVSDSAPEQVAEAFPEEISSQTFSEEFSMHKKVVDECTISSCQSVETGKFSNEKPEETVENALKTSVQNVSGKCDGNSSVHSNSAYSESEKITEAYSEAKKSLLNSNDKLDANKNVTDCCIDSEDNFKEAAETSSQEKTEISSQNFSEKFSIYEKAVDHCTISDCESIETAKNISDEKPEAIVENVYALKTSVQNFNVEGDENSTIHHSAHRASEKFTEAKASLLNSNEKLIINKNIMDYCIVSEDNLKKTAKTFSEEKTKTSVQNADAELDVNQKAVGHAIIPVSEPDESTENFSEKNTETFTETFVDFDKKALGCSIVLDIESEQTAKAFLEEKTKILPQISDNELSICEPTVDCCPIAHCKTKVNAETFSEEKTEVFVQNFTSEVDVVDHTVIPPTEPEKMSKHFSEEKTSVQNFNVESDVKKKTADQIFNHDDDVKTAEAFFEEKIEIPAQNFIEKVNTSEPIFANHCSVSNCESKLVAETSEEKSKLPVQDFNADLESCEKAINHAIISCDEPEEIAEKNSEQRTKIYFPNFDVVSDVNVKIVEQNILHDNSEEIAENNSVEKARTSVKNFNSESGVKEKITDCHIFVHNESEKCAEIFSEEKTEASVQNLSTNYDVNEKTADDGVIIHCESEIIAENISAKNKVSVQTINAEFYANEKDSDHGIISHNKSAEITENFSDEKAAISVETFNAKFDLKEKIPDHSIPDSESAEITENFPDEKIEMSVETFNADSDIKEKTSDHSHFSHSESAEITEDFSDEKIEMSVETFNADSDIKEKTSDHSHFSHSESAEITEDFSDEKIEMPVETFNADLDRKEKTSDHSSFSHSESAEITENISDEKTERSVETFNADLDRKEKTSDHSSFSHSESAEITENISDEKTERSVETFNADVNGRTANHSSIDESESKHTSEVDLKDKRIITLQSFDANEHIADHCLVHDNESEQTSIAFSAKKAKVIHDFESVDLYKTLPKENTKLSLQDDTSLDLPSSDINMEDKSRSPPPSPFSELSSDVQMIVSLLVESACSLVEENNGVNFDSSNLLVKNTDSKISNESFAYNTPRNCQIPASCEKENIAIENKANSEILSLTTSITSGKEIILGNCLFTTFGETETLDTESPTKKISTQTNDCWTFKRKSAEISVDNLASKVCASPTSSSSKRLKVEKETLSPKNFSKNTSFCQDDRTVRWSKSSTFEHGSEHDKVIAENSTPSHCLKNFSDVPNIDNTSSEYVTDAKENYGKIESTNSYASPSGMSEKHFSYKAVSSNSDVSYTDSTEKINICSLSESLDVNVDIMLHEDSAKEIPTENADFEFMQTSVVKSLKRTKKNFVNKIKTFGKKYRKNSEFVNKSPKSDNVKITTSKAISLSVINSKKILNRYISFKSKTFKKAGAIKSKSTLSKSENFQKRSHATFRRHTSRTGVAILEQTINKSEICKQPNAESVKMTAHDIPNVEKKTDVNIKELPCDNMDYDNDLKQTSKNALEQMDAEVYSDDASKNVSSHDSKLFSDNILNNICDSTVDTVGTSTIETKRKSTGIATANASSDKESTSVLTAQCSKSPKDPPVEKTESKIHKSVKSCPTERLNGKENQPDGMHLEKETSQPQPGNSSQSSESTSISPSPKLSNFDKNSLEMRIQNIIKKYGCEYVLALLDSS